MTNLEEATDGFARYPSQGLAHLLDFLLEILGPDAEQRNSYGGGNGGTTSGRHSLLLGLLVGFFLLLGEARLLLPTNFSGLCGMHRKSTIRPSTDGRREM